MKTVQEILNFCNQQIQEYNNMGEQHCWTCVNVLQDVISFINSDNIPMPTEDDERNYVEETWDSEQMMSGWEELEEEMRADQNINYIKSQQQLD